MIQIIKYKCCNKTYAACTEPECYIDKEWLKSLKKAVQRGDSISMEQPGSWKFEKCTCNEKKELLNLFDQEVVK